MPMSNGTYYAPTWNNNAPPAIDATELQAISDTAAIVPTLVRPNLLDNWYFVGGGSQQGGGQFPINQRGSTSYTTNSAYSIDRWYKRSGSATISIESSGLKLLCTASISAGAYLLDQTLEFPQKFRGMPFTCSVLVDSIQGTWAFGLRDAGGTTAVTSKALSAGLVSVSGTIQSDTTDLRFALLSGSATVSNNYVIIKAVKFEIGSTQTLAHYDSANSVWVLNEVPNYEEQLFRCQTSTADSTDTYANQPNLVGFQVKPNLATNWYFIGGGSQTGAGIFPINTRGQTSYSGTADMFTVDRWRTSNAYTTVAIGSTGLTISAPSGNTPYLLQPITNLARFIRGKEATLTVWTTSGLYTTTGTLPSSDPGSTTVYLSTTYGHLLYMSSTWYIRLQGPSGGSVTIIAVKLEIGHTQTLVYNTGTVGSPTYYLTSAPDYAYELLRCSPPGSSTDTNTNLAIYRQEALYASDTNPTVNGFINWTYG